LATTLSLNPIVNVIINLSPLSAIRNAFDLGLIIGTSSVIPSADRIKIYTDTDSMLEDGFTLTSPEYLAAQLYFASPGQPTRIAIGRQDSTNGSLRTIALKTAGTGYAVNDILTVVQSGASGGMLRVDSIDTGGVITGVSILTHGTGYTVATGKATTVLPVGGTGCTIDVSAVGEDALMSIVACRLANADWYSVFTCSLAKNDILAIAQYIESCTPHSAHFALTNDIDARDMLDGNVIESLEALNYRRTLCMYHESANVVASIQGYAMGANNGTRNSAYTLAYKQMPGVTVSNLTNTQVINIKAKNGNVYISRGGQYEVFEQGHMSNGTSFDELINLDKLANDIQLAVMDALYQAPKIPQTEAGVTQLINAISEPCRQAVNVGFIAPGLWKGQPILNLNTGDVLQEGFLIQAESINSQTQADRDARKAPYIYVAVKLAGAIEFVVIRVDVNR
jgi:hypothetical protein